MKKIFSAVIVAMIISVSAAISVSAQTPRDEGIAILLNSLEIMQGDENGDMQLDRNVTRAEFTKIAIAMSEEKNTVALGLKISPYPDVPYNEWYAPYIKAAMSAGLVYGYVDATFRPNNTVTYEEAITIMLRVLGYDDSSLGDSYPYGQIAMAKGIDLLDNVEGDIGAPMTRYKVMQMAYNALQATAKLSTTSQSTSTSTSNSTSSTSGNNSNNNSQSSETKSTTSSEITSTHSGQLISSVHECSVYDDVDIIVTSDEDDSLQSGRVLTSSGIAKKGDYFSDSWIGTRGTMFIKNSKIISVVPDEEYNSYEFNKYDDYTVKSVIGNDLIFDNLSVSVGDTTKTYYKTNTITYSNIASNAKKGDILRIYYDPNGTIEYALLIANDTTSKNNLERYVIYSQLDNAIVCYKNGSFTQLDVTDSTTCYRDSAQSSYGAVKSEMAMGDIIYVKRDGGDIDYLSYEKGNMEGPVKVTSSSWTDSFDTDSSTTVMRDGNKVSASAIQTNDIIYYSGELNMILAYTNKVTGVYESASPSKDAPSTVTVSGKTYSIEGVDAFNALSSSGSFKYGDTVTLLLGRNGDVAGVATSSDTTASTVSAAGYVISSGKKEFSNADGTTYSSYYIQIVTADGTVNEYATTSDYSSRVGTVCSVSFSGGKASVKQLSSGGASGTVDGSAYTIGSTKFAENVKILDTVVSTVYDTIMYKKIYPQRLDGINISSSNVLYCGKNSAGEISEMILKNVTGDAYTYGAITNRTVANKTIVKDEETEEKTTYSTYYTYAYTIDSDGTQYTYSTNVDIAAKTGCKLTMNGEKLVSMEQLSKYAGYVTKLTDTEATINGKTYKLSDKTLVYKKTDTLQKIPLSEAQSGSYKLTAYYDKTEEKGGRIRIIIAE